MSSISGGSRWHWRAWRNAANWRALSKAVDGFHRDFGPQGGELLLFGCSAGWMLQTAWLQSFSSIIAVDLDPLAKHLFRLRHPGLKQLAWHQGNALDTLDALLIAHPQAAIYFDNMLGQQALIELHELKASDKDLALLEKSLSQLPQRLRGRFWGSLHDRVSGPVRMPSSEFKRYVHQPLSHRSPRAQPNTQLVRWLSEVEALQAHGEWLDHLTSGVFHADNPRVYLLWPFAPQYWHWLEMAWVKPSTDTLG